MKFLGQFRTAINTAGPMILAGLSAHLAVVLMSGSGSQVPLLTALASSVMFASVLLACTSGQDSNIARSPRPAMLQLQAGGLALVAIGIGAWLTSRLLGTGAVFYCEPQVPWRIEIALFGSFAVGTLTFLARARQRAWVVYPFIMVAFMWIAPFYGFFSAPLFLGVSLNSMCADRSIATVLLTAIGMVAGEQAGRGFAGWMRF